MKLTVDDSRLRIKRLVLGQEEINHVIVFEDGLFVLDDFSQDAGERDRDMRRVPEHITSTDAVPA